MTQRRILISIIPLFLMLNVSSHAREIDRQKIDAYLARAVDQTHIPGIVAMVVDKDHIRYSGAFGHRNVAQDIEMTMDSIFRIASMTKPVTSVAVQMLIEEGKVGLDDPISSYLPEFKDKVVFADFNAANGNYTTRPANDEITVRHLLTHTSGIGYGFSNAILARLLETDPEMSVQGLPLLFDPGTRWAYGESTRVLGTLVETVAGQSLDDFMAERIFGPLGMQETSFRIPTAKIPRVVTVHRKTEAGLVETPNPNEIDLPDYGDHGLFSTAADYSRFIQMFLNSGRAHEVRPVLKKASTQAMGTNHTGNVRVELQVAAMPEWTRPFPLGAGRDSFGLGFQVTGEHNEADMRAPGSMSWAGIFNTEFWIDPENGIGAVLLMQYLPFYDEAAIETLRGFEKRVYESL